MDRDGASPDLPVLLRSPSTGFCLSFFLLSPPALEDRDTGLPALGDRFAERASPFPESPAPASGEVFTVAGPPRPVTRRIGFVRFFGG